MASSVTEETLLRVERVRKVFGRVTALDEVDFDLREREVAALVGDNGAGKSTLVKVLSGVLQPDEGEICLRGNPLHLRNPADAQAHGIETVYQDLALAGPLDIESNMFLGRETRRAGFAGKILRRLDVARMRRETSRRMAALNIFALPTQLVETLSGGQRQVIAIARAVIWGSEIVILDEPTAALGIKQAAMVLDLVRHLRANGHSVILVSHNLQDVFAVADRIQVLRLGRRVGVAEPSTHSMNDVVAMITGSSAGVGAA